MVGARHPGRRQRLHTRSAVASVLLCSPGAMLTVEGRPAELARRSGAPRSRRSRRTRATSSALERPAPRAAPAPVRAQQAVADQHRVVARGRAAHSMRVPAGGRSERAQRSSARGAQPTAIERPDTRRRAARRGPRARRAARRRRRDRRRAAARAPSRSRARASTRGPRRSRAAPSTARASASRTRSESTLPPPSAITSPGPRARRAARSTSSLLGLPERGLAAAARTPRATECPKRSREQLVAVRARAAERRRELAARRRLAGAHEADQDECQPIRSR